jgi:hypothetical protein
MTMREDRCLDVNQVLFRGGNLVRAALMAALGSVVVLAELGCSSSSTSGNLGGAGQGGTATGGSRATTSAQAGTSSTGQTGSGGSLASGGNPASGGSASVPIGGTGPSSSTFTPTGGSSSGGTAAGGTRATGGTTVSGGTTGAVGGAAGMTAIVGGTPGGNGGSVSGGSATGGSAAAGSAGTGRPDAAADAERAPDSGSPGDAAQDEDTQTHTDADVGGEGDSDVALSCTELLFDNQGPPDNYPVIYRDAAITPDPAESTRLSSTPLAGGPFDDNNTLPAVEAFLSQWEALYGYQGIQTTAGPVSCGVGPLCVVRFTQNYCGLSIYSSEAASGGTWWMDFYSQTGKVLQVISGLVHMIPMPRNVLVTRAQVISAIAGKKFTYDCGAPTGSYTVEISDQDQFIIPGPSIYVQTSPTAAPALEYRLAIAVNVTSKGTSWTVYVDAIDGSFLKGFANFICS